MEYYKSLLSGLLIAAKALLTVVSLVSIFCAYRFKWIYDPMPGSRYHEGKTLRNAFEVVFIPFMTLAIAFLFYPLAYWVFAPCVKRIRNVKVQATIAIGLTIVLPFAIFFVVFNGIMSAV